MSKSETRRVSDPICDFEEKLTEEQVKEILKDFDDTKKVIDMSNKED